MKKIISHRCKNEVHQWCGGETLGGRCQCDCHHMPLSWWQEQGFFGGVKK